MTYFEMLKNAKDEEEMLKLITELRMLYLYGRYRRYGSTNDTMLRLLKSEYTE